MITSPIIYYEQPLNEQLRVCLRVEQLLQQLHYLAEHPAPQATRMVITYLLEIVNILDRPDLKSKLVKALNQRAARLATLEQNPQVDSQKLRALLIELDQLLDYLHAESGKLGQTLRDNEFLNNIRLHLAKPGGASSFNCPAYHFWLQQTFEQRNRDLLIWLKTIEPIEKIMMLLLQVTRESGQFQQKFAPKGFYQEALNPNMSYQLIRIHLSGERKVFPEISVGRHQLFVHFFSPNFNSRSVHAIHEVSFKLACCAL